MLIVEHQGTQLPQRQHILTGNRESIMVILRKLDTRNLSIEAYEQYGMHDTYAPDILVTKIWAHREQVIDKGELPFGMTRWCTGEIRENIHAGR